MLHSVLKHSVEISWTVYVVNIQWCTTKSLNYDLMVGKRQSSTKSLNYDLMVGKGQISYHSNVLKTYLSES